MLLGDYVLKFLLSKKIERIFLITGGAIAFVVDAFSRNKNIKYTCVAHEQSAAMMADAYYRVKKRLSATMVTSGPGAQNLLTGIACSWFDSIPSIHITGQVNTRELSSFSKTTKKVRQVGFQETDIVSIVKPITKFAYQLKKASKIKYILEKAFYKATSGRPGPVLIDIPMDLQRVKINPVKLKKFIVFRKKKKKLFVKKICQLLEKSSRPIIILGGGIKYSNSEKIVKKFLKKIQIPIVTTWSGFGLVSSKNKLYIGNVGVYGSRCANFAVQNSDLIINLGSRLDTRVTGGVPRTFGRKSKIISVDIDKFELNKKRGLNNFLKVNVDLNYFLKNFFKKSKKFKFRCSEKWFKQCVSWKKNYSNYNITYAKQKIRVNPYFFIKELSNILTKSDIIIADDGGHLTWTMQAFEIKEDQKLFSAFGNSPMGYALPAAIGACFANNKKRVVCIDGDGSIQINIQELQTLSFNRLPIKIFVINNDGYGIIKQFQELYMKKRYEASTPRKGVSNPDFAKIASAYKLNYTKITNHKNLKEKIKKVIESKVAEFVEVFVENNQKIIPKLEFGRPIEDLSPLLDRKELERNMFVSTQKSFIKINQV